MTRMWPFFTMKDKNTLAHFHGREWIVACVLLNCRICAEGGQQGVFFNLVPPTLGQYLGGGML